MIGYFLSFEFAICSGDYVPFHPAVDRIIGILYCLQDEENQ